MAVLKCHMDNLQSDGLALLLRCVAPYVPKFSDAFPHEALSDSAPDFSIAKRILSDYHPGEPGVWLTLAGGPFPACFYGSTLVSIRAPWAHMDDKPDFVTNYEEARWHDNLTLLQFLRITHQKGGVIQWLKRIYDKSTFAGTLHKFAVQFRTSGEKLIAVDMVHPLNDRFFGQWLALHTPFKNLDDLVPPFVLRKVQQLYLHVACALVLRPDFWRDPVKMCAEIELGAHADARIDTVIDMVRAQAGLVQKYLHVTLNKDAEAKTAHDDFDP
jgi:hypothetical protein